VLCFSDGKTAKFDGNNPSQLRERLQVMAEDELPNSESMPGNCAGFG